MPDTAAAPIPEAEEQAPARSRRSETQFVILKMRPKPAEFATGVIDAINGQDTFFEVVARDVTANSYKAAVARHCEANKDQTDLDGSYVAVKAEDWRPVPVTAKRETIFSFGDVA